VENFKGGKLKDFIHEWEGLTSDKFILNTIKGYNIELDEIPKQNFIPKPIDFNDSEKHKISAEIHTFLKKGIIKKVQSHEVNEYYSNIFVRPKKDGTVRMILNLKNFNECVSKIHFKMDTLNTAVNNIQKHDFFASIDLKDSYFSVPIHEMDQKYLKFNWNGIHYQFCVLPQGLPKPKNFYKNS